MMDEFDDGRADLVVPAITCRAAAGAQQHQRRAHALTATVDDVLGYLPDQHHIGVESIAKDQPRRWPSCQARSGA